MCRYQLLASPAKIFTSACHTRLDEPDTDTILECFLEPPTGKHIHIMGQILKLPDGEGVVGGLADEGRPTEV